jgi:prokaryotic YEATS domain
LRASDPYRDESTDWAKQLNTLVQWEVRRFQIASVALVIIGLLTLSFALYVGIAAHPKLEWQIVALLGVTALCFALPLLRKIDFNKDGGGLETGNPISIIQDMLDKQQAEAAAARTESFEQTRQHVGALAAQVSELSEQVARVFPNEVRHESQAVRENFGAPPAEISEPTLREITKLLPEPTVDDDPQHGRFGGAEERNGRKLTARTGKSALGPRWLTVLLRVESTDGTPLRGKYAYFFLHDTFEPDVYRVKVDKSGKFAELEIAAVGAFTAGVVADKGNTKLEIDLATSANLDAPRWWRQS